jgi:hypothetical protein
MTHGLCRPALAVELAFDFQEFDHDLVRHPRGAGKLGRTFFHELLHCWQVLSQPYLTNVAAAEFLQLVNFRDRGELPDLVEGQDPEGRLLAKHPDIGFSAQQLSEALCRFWDVLVVGADVIYEACTGSPLPVDYLDELPRDPVSGAPATSAEMFKLAMLAEDAYADPYRLALDRWGDKAFLVFPLVAHFSLQTGYPIDVFAAAIQREIVLPPSEPAMGEPPWFHIWKEARAAVLFTAGALGVPVYDSSSEVISRTILSTHKIFVHYLELIRMAQSDWSAEYLEYAFSALGAERGALATVFHPSVTLLNGGRWLNAAAAEINFVKTVAPDKLQLHLTKMADIGQSMLETQRKLRLALLLTRKRSGVVGDETSLNAAVDSYPVPPKEGGLGLDSVSGIEIVRSVVGTPKVPAPEGATAPPVSRQLGRWRLQTGRRDIGAAAWGWLIDNLSSELRVAELTVIPGSVDSIAEGASEGVRMAAAQLKQRLARRWRGSASPGIVETITLNLDYFIDRQFVRQIGIYILSGQLKESPTGPMRVKITNGFFTPISRASSGATMGAPVPSISLLARLDESSRAALQSYLYENFGDAAPIIGSEPLIGRNQ